MSLTIFHYLISIVFSFFASGTIFSIDTLNIPSFSSAPFTSTSSLIVNDFLKFSLIWNKGIGFGLLRLDNVFYHLISLLIVLIILFLIYLIIKSKTLDKILLALVVGGALGNCYDRVTFLAVPDFIDFHYKNLHWFTFNFADIFITSGIIMIIFKEVFFKNEN